LPTVLRDLKASPASDLLQRGFLRDGQCPGADAVNVNGICLHDFRGQRRALGFLSKRWGNESRRTEENHEELRQLSHEWRIAIVH